MKKRYFSAEQAANILGVSKAILYAYVSRGVICSEEVGTQSRTRGYLAENVHKLRERREYRRNPTQDAFYWGMPVE